MDMNDFPCATCGQPSNHWSGSNGGEHLCCKCYVATGNPPADWHPGCVRAANDNGGTVAARYEGQREVNGIPWDFYAVDLTGTLNGG